MRSEPHHTPLGSEKEAHVVPGSEVLRIQPKGLIISIDGAGRIALERESIALIKPVVCRHLPKRRSAEGDQ